MREDWKRRLRNLDGRFRRLWAFKAVFFRCIAFYGYCTACLLFSLEMTSEGGEKWNEKGWPMEKEKTERRRRR